MCANVAAEGEYCREVDLDDLFSLDFSFCILLNNSWRVVKIGEETNLIPIVVWKLRTWMSSLDPSTVYQNSDLVPIFQDRRCKSLDFGL